MGCAGGDPVVRHRLRAIDPVGHDHLAARAERRLAEIGAHIFPHDPARRRHLEEAAIHALVDERVSVGKPPHVTDERAVERPIRAASVACAVFPDDLFLYRVDLENARAAGEVELGRRIARFTLIVEDKQVARAGQALGDDLRVVLAADLIDGRRQLAGQAPRADNRDRAATQSFPSPYR
jgi:hypothetical protein